MAERILAYLSIQSGRVKRGSLEVLSRCREISDAHGMGLDALIAHPDADSFADEVGLYGPDRILTVKNQVLARHENAEVIRAIQGCVEETNPSIVAMASSEATKDILGALAIRTGAAVIPDASSMDLVDGALVASRPVLAAKYVANVQSSSLPAIVSVRSGSYPVVEAPSSPPIETLDVDFESIVHRATLREIVEASGGTVDLSEAEAVVAAGRGVKDEEGKRLILELADALGAAIGASRAVVENGLFPATAQIGQTGKVVSPDLYIAVGISGAI